MRYRLLGKTGLRVSELALGTMTFGETMGWGAPRETSARLLDLYADAGGNFLDTANRYSQGNSETILGELLQGRRDAFVLATKYTLQTDADDPNTAGNHRKNLVRSVEASLRRLRTDYLDLLWVHARDVWTPVPEVMRALDDLVRSGKVLYIGVSDWPAWEIAQANTLAEVRGWTPFSAAQLRYNLLERTPERELLPMARTFDLAVTAWGPLAEGRLTGKYLDPVDGARLSDASAHIFEHSNGGSDEIVRLVVHIASEIGCTPAQVALSWLRTRHGNIVPILGAKREDQLRDNLGSLAVTLDETQQERLDQASVIPLGFPHDLLRQPHVRSITYGQQWPIVDDRRATVRREVNDAMPSR